MQPSRCRADELVQSALYIHVQVFERSVPRELAVLDFPLDQLQAFDDCCCVLFANDALASQHTGVSHRSGDVLPVQPPVVMNGNGVG